MHTNLKLLCREIAEKALRTMVQTLRPWRRQFARQGAVAVILLMLFICTLAAKALSTFFDPSSLMMIYLVGATAVAVRNGLRAAMAFVVSSAVLYDILFLKPYWTFTKMEPHHYLTFSLMLAVGCLIGSLASSLRQKTLEIEDKVQRAQARNALANDLARATRAEAVQQALSNAIHSALGLKSRVLLDAAPGLESGARSSLPEAAAGHALRIPLLGASAQIGVLVVDGGALLEQRVGDMKLLHAFADQATIVLERQHLERINAEAKVEAEAERLRSTLLAAISHDFRTPITTIVGSVSTLLEQGAGIAAEQHHALLRGVLDEASRVHHLMSNLLDLTQIEGGAVRPRFEWCPVDELVAAVLRPLEPKLRDYRLATDFDPDGLLWCDPRLLEQLLDNLLGNACRYTPKGCTIQIAVAIDDEGAQLTVSDDGPGFPAGREQEMVKKFSRGSSLSGHGTGLGLAICAAIAKLHGGRLEVLNRAGAWIRLSVPQPLPLAAPGEALL